MGPAGLVVPEGRGQGRMPGDELLDPGVAHAAQQGGMRRVTSFYTTYTTLS